VHFFLTSSFPFASIFFFRAHFFQAPGPNFLESSSLRPGVFSFLGLPTQPTLISDVKSFLIVPSSFLPETKSPSNTLCGPPTPRICSLEQAFNVPTYHIQVGASSKFSGDLARWRSFYFYQIFGYLLFHLPRKSVLFLFFSS